MNPPPDPLPKLRLAPQETADELAHRFARENRPGLLQRESALEDSLHPFRVGSVPYLNAAPLTRGLEEQIVFLPPSALAEKLRAEELDAALISVSEVLLTGTCDILDGIAIASLGEVKSVFLAHTEPLEQIRHIACDPASLCGLALLKILLAEKGLSPALSPLSDYSSAPAQPNVFLIGNPAIEFSRGSHPHQIWDLGAAWFELTGLPFVYAVWALRRIPNDALRRKLREARNFGIDTLDSIISSRTEFDYEFRKDYLEWHIHYHLGTEERKGLRRFMDLMRKHGLGEVHEPRFLS